MHYHFWFDLLSYILGALVAYAIKRDRNQNTAFSYGYYVSLLLGVFIGAFLIGSLNMLYSTNEFKIGKSVMGAIFGGIVFVEIFKKLSGFKGGSTGAFFVPSLALGICMGRIGCFIAGLEDYTCGIETECAFGYDFGDGIFRHPVQLYESFAMAMFFAYSLWLYRVKYEIFEKKVFYYFVAFYSLQRFVWEFLKPYASIVFGMNIFQICAIFMLFYALSHLYLLKDNK